MFAIDDRELPIQQVRALCETSLALPADYSPQVLEVYDQYGLLFSAILGEEVSEQTRTADQKSEYFAWYLDGQLALFYAGGQILTNRLERMAARAETLLSELTDRGTEETLAAATSTRLDGESRLDSRA